MRFYPDSQEQTIAFEPDSLPGQTFKVVVPEIVSDADGVIVPWNHKAPRWEKE